MISSGVALGFAALSAARAQETTVVKDEGRDWDTMAPERGPTGDEFAGCYNMDRGMSITCEVSRASAEMIVIWKRKANARTL